ncbi:MAG: serine hydrolase [Actinomycetota bacterium]
MRSALVVLAAVVALAACGSDDDKDAAAATTEPPPTTAAPSTTITPTTTTVDGPFAAIDPIVSAFVDDNELNGAGLIVVDAVDGIVLHEHWGEFSEDRISLIASSSKMISAGVLLHLADDGLLDLDAPVADVADWGDGNPDVTPAQLLSNSSGLVGLAPNPFYEPYLCMFDAEAVLEDCGQAIFTTPDDDGDVGPPDTAFDYGGAQWQVAGAVAEAASGQTWDQLIDEIYVQPCGLETLAFNNHFAQLPSLGYPTEFAADPSTLAATDNPNIEGGAYVTTGDYGELLLMILRDGRCGDEQVLSPEALDAMLDDRIGAVYGGDAAPGTGYGLGWWIDRDTGLRSDPGLYGATAWLDLEDGYGAYLVIEATGDEGLELALQLGPVIDEAIAIR